MYESACAESLKIADEYQPVWELTGLVIWVSFLRNWEIWRKLVCGLKALWIHRIALDDDDHMGEII